MQKLMLMLKREVESLHGSRVEMSTLINKVSSLIIHFDTAINTADQGKKKFKNVCIADMTFDTLYSTLRYTLNLEDTYEGVFWQLENAWTKKKYQLLGVDVPENLI
tara:strand:+ start:1420 stop:1737 length:318 start_codon:yes stop_codon:yes gene_type:complete